MFDTRARALLETERRWSGRKLERKLVEMQRTFGLDEFQYYAEIARVADLPEARLFDPLTVRRIKADGRERLRRLYTSRPATAWRRRGETHPAAATLAGATSNSTRSATFVRSTTSSSSEVSESAVVGAGANSSDQGAAIIVWTGRRADVADAASTATGQ